jgi:hypothetical protein
MDLESSLDSPDVNTAPDRLFNYFVRVTRKCKRMADFAVAATPRSHAFMGSNDNLPDDVRILGIVFTLSGNSSYGLPAS